jgi:hypothetical protein
MGSACTNDSRSTAAASVVGANRERLIAYRRSPVLESV